MKREILRFQNGRKDTGDISRIYNLSVQIFRNEIFGLVVENYAERRGVINVLSGRARLDFGWVYLMERELEWESYEKTLKENVCVVSRKNGCIGKLKVKDNIFVLKEGIRWTKLLSNIYKDADRFFKEVQCGIDPEERVENLRPLQQKAVELLQAFVRGKKLVILAEMDEFFTAEDTAGFFSFVFKLKEMGMDFFIVSNNLNVLFEYTSCLYVFMKGRTRHRILRKAFSEKDIRAVVEKGTKINADMPLPTKSDALALEFFRVKTDFCEDLSFKLNCGEILNFIDLNMFNWTLPADILEGKDPVKGGQILLGEKRFKPGRSGSAFGSSIGVIGEVSHEIDYFSDETILDYMAMVMSRKGGIRGFSRGYIKSLRSELLSTGEFTDKELITPLFKADSALIQKAQYYRWIFYRPKLLICMRPLSSSNYNIQKLTYHLISLAADRGIAVLILTMSVYEACIMGGRIVVLKSGKTYETVPSEFRNFKTINDKSENSTPFAEDRKF